MAADIAIPRREDWILSNPWPYGLFGFVGCVLALAVTRLLGPEWDRLRGAFFLAGLVGAGVAVVLRLNSSRPAFLDQLGDSARDFTILALGLVFGLAALALTVAAAMSIAGSADIPWRPGSLIVVWIAVAPLSAFAALTCWRARGAEGVLPWGNEAAMLLLLAGFSCILAAWSLYFGRALRIEWDTMRLFLSVVAFACFLAAPFFLVSQTVRRVAVSCLFLLHFVGIGTAALSQPPTPWIVGHLWVRIYRPYLEFMYLNNAYHFYAPEPDASTYLWFRAIFEDERGHKHGVWRKVPDMDEDGWHRHTVALEYQRCVAMTENVAQASGTNPNLFDWTVNPLAPNKDFDWVATYYMVPAMKNRWRKSDTAVNFGILKKKLDEEGKPVIMLGKIDPAKPPPKEEAAVGLNPVDYPNVYPFHPLIPTTQQYAPPSDFAFRLLGSFARHAGLKPHPEHPEWKLSSVKVYKVRHTIIPEDAVLKRTDPQDPLYYQPFYMGEYLPNGELKDAADPLLFWLMPVMRRDYSNPKSLAADFARRHAGDEKWACVVGEDGKRRWFAPNRATFEVRRP